MPIRSEKGPDGSTKHVTWDILDKLLVAGIDTDSRNVALRAANVYRKRYRGTGAQVQVLERGVSANCTSFSVLCVVARRKVEVAEQDCGCWLIVGPLNRGKPVHPCWRHR